MVALITEHEIHEVPITGALVASFLALTTTWFLLVTLHSSMPSQRTNGQGTGFDMPLHGQDEEFMVNLPEPYAHDKRSSLWKACRNTPWLVIPVFGRMANGE